MLRQFHYIDPNGKDQGVNVRNRTNELVKLLSDVDAIRQERKKARVNKNKYGGVEGGMGGGGFSSGSGASGGRYGGFGSETGGYGGYSGEVYGDGGGFGGQETDFSGTQRRGDQFEEYDEGDDVQTTARPTRTTAAASRSTATTSAKREAPKPKAPQPDLFDFGDEPVTSSSSGKAPVAAAPVDDGDDDFDDFQSATPSAAQPSMNPLAALSPPPPTTSTTTSSTHFAQPKPLAPGQSAGFNNILSTASPAPSATSSILSPSASTFASPPVQSSPAPAFPASTGHKPTGPNYFTSVPVTANQTMPAATSSSASFQRPGMTPSYASSTSAASLGKPTPKAASSGGGDAFGSLWSTASSAAGVTKTASTSKGPDLASLSKAKSQAGIWGAASAASGGGGSAPAPQSNTAAKPATPLGNGLDDLLG